MVYVSCVLDKLIRNFTCSVSPPPASIGAAARLHCICLPGIGTARPPPAQHGFATLPA